MKMFCKKRIRSMVIKLLVTALVLTGLGFTDLSQTNIYAKGDSLTPSENGIPADLGYISGNTINAGARIVITGRYHLVLVEDGEVSISDVKEMKRFANAKYDKRKNCTYVKTMTNKKAMAIDGAYRIHLSDDEGNTFYLNVEMLMPLQKVWKKKNKFDVLDEDFKDFNTAIANGKAKTVKLVTIKKTDSKVRDIRWYSGKEPLDADKTQVFDKKGNLLFNYKINVSDNSITVAPAYGSKKPIPITADVNGRRFKVKFSKMKAKK